MVGTPKITVRTVVHASMENAWLAWTGPEHIVKWAFASDDWHAPRAENDLRFGGKFLTRMEAKATGEGFDLNGEYALVEPHARIVSTMEGGREVDTTFAPVDGGIEVVETFESETENALELQRSGWQAILENYRKHAETLYPPTGHPETVASRRDSGPTIVVTANCGS